MISCPYSVVANKWKIRTATEAVHDIPNGASLLVGGKKYFSVVKGSWTYELLVSTVLLQNCRTKILLYATMAVVFP